MARKNHGEGGGWHGRYGEASAGEMAGTPKKVEGALQKVKGGGRPQSGYGGGGGRRGKKTHA
jgi:hypothetical protein